MLRVRVVEPQALPAVPAAFYALGVGELGAEVSDDEPEHLSEALAVDATERIDGVDNAIGCLVRQAYVELEADPSHEHDEDALLVLP